MRVQLSRAQLDGLLTTAWGQHYFGGVVTNRAFPKRVARRLGAMGLIESLGLVALCDGDGFTIMPERFREGWRLTAAGIAELMARGETHYLRGPWFDQPPPPPPAKE